MAGRELPGCSAQFRGYVSRSVDRALSACPSVGLLPAIALPVTVRAGHESLTLAFCLATRRCMNLGPSFLCLLVGLDTFVQQQLTDLDSVGRRCATGLHKPATPETKGHRGSLDGPVLDLQA